ncbi:DUF4476 domain-containing protein [Chitinophaga arvensicola]|uniref:DUF4476 domain-containing protein n=1 Tax=Chitinophaga arvensicola TaxID=29529 RepID=A0A1I0N794_9BACT|nr:DUF4476 domain-containing protein [Chitinophaga arvensicola]SEV96995.1 protein of unknown function [Chitinophaga arvensicola]
MHLKYRTVIFVWACLLLCGRLWAQDQRHYVYIQSEKGQPFYVKHNGKVLSSTERGYIIIPQLENGTAPITVGFAGKDSKEAQFNVRVAKNDQGFLLKQSGESGYSLYNLQTFRELKSDAGDGALAVATPAPAAVEPELDTAKKEMMANLQKDLETTFADKAIVTGPSPSKPAAAKSANPFSSALDKVVVTGDDRNEPEPEVKKEAAVAVTDAPPVAADGEVKKSKGKKHKNGREPLSEEEQAILNEVLAEEGKTAASEAAADDAAKAVATEEPAPAKKSKKHKAKEGDPDFIEFQDDKAPTAVEAAATTTPIVVEVPVVAAEETPTPAKKKKKKIFDDTEHPANIITDSSGYGIAITDEAPAKSSKKKKKRGDDEETAAVSVDAAGAPVGAAVAAEETTSSKKKSGTRLVNSDCANIMDDATFRKVLRKFVAARTDNSMIDVFQKQTRNYCLETAQIKTLVQLLTADDTRYRLLDAAYSKTYDTEKYGSLETLLIDDYYRGRFKAMIHK